MKIKIVYLCLLLLSCVVSVSLAASSPLPVVPNMMKYVGMGFDLSIGYPVDSALRSQVYQPYWNNNETIYLQDQKYSKPDGTLVLSRPLQASKLEPSAVYSMLLGLVQKPPLQPNLIAQQMYMAEQSFFEPFVTHWTLSSSADGAYSKSQQANLLNKAIHKSAAAFTF